MSAHLLLASTIHVTVRYREVAPPNMESLHYMSTLQVVVVVVVVVVVFSCVLTSLSERRRPPEQKC